MKPSESLDIATAQEKIDKIAHHFQAIMETLGLNLADPSISATPRRVAKMYVEELFSGLDSSTFPKMTYHHEVFDPHNIVLIKNVSLKSICEHHFIPFFGSADIAYLPKKKLLGLSKINRVVDYLCRRPQIQERLTAQIAETLSTLLETDDVAVSIEATHLCVAMRGIKDPNSRTSTHVLRGKFLNDPTFRQEFLSSTQRQLTSNF